jgi:methyl-accepting chemotaxis protein
LRQSVDRWVSRSTILTATPVVVALLLSGVISFSYNWKLKTFRDAADHTFRTITGVDGVLLRLQDAETGQRGFIITGADEYLAPFEDGRRDLNEMLERLKSLMSDNEAQMTRLLRLEKLSRDKLAELSETINVRASLGFEAARERVAANLGKQTMDEIRRVTAEVRRAEETLLEERVGNARFAERMMMFVAIVCVMISLLGRFLAHLLQKRLI